MPEEIIQILKSQSEQIDFIAKKVLKHDERSDLIDERFDLITEKVLEHHERLDRIEQNMVTKKDHQEIVETLDHILGIVKKTDQEVIMMGARVNRIEKIVETHNKDILQLKPALGLH